MNKLIERLDDHFNKLTFVMNSSTETQEFLRSIPNPMPATHVQAVEWHKVGNAEAVSFYPAPHPLDVVASVTNHFEDLDELKLVYLAGQGKIDVKGVKISQKADDGLPKTLRDALLILLREKCPMPKGKPVQQAKTVQVQERIIVLDPDVAAMDVKGLEKIAAMNNGLNAFKAAQNQGASIAKLRELVCRLREQKKQAEAKARQGTAGVLQRA